MLVWIGGNPVGVFNFNDEARTNISVINKAEVGDLIYDTSRPNVSPTPTYTKTSRRHIRSRSSWCLSFGS